MDYCDSGDIDNCDVEGVWKCGNVCFSKCFCSKKYQKIYIFFKYIIFVSNTSKRSKNIKKLIRSNFFQILTKNRLKLTLKYF